VPRTPPRSPSRPNPTALPDPLLLPWRPPGASPTPPDSLEQPAGVPRTPPVDPRSEPGWAAGLPEAGAADRRLIEAEIGRDVRGSVAVAARCRYGLPAVVRTAPLLPDGTPFPTLYWLACPAARVAVGRLEAAGWNAKLSDRVAAEPDLAAAHAAAHTSYLAQRDIMARLPGDPGVGGLPGRVKCLHALYAHQAATGANPIGRIVGQAVDPIDCPGPCVDTIPALEASRDPARAPAPGPAGLQPPARDPGTRGPDPPAPGPPVGALQPQPPAGGAPEREGSPPATGVGAAVHSPGALGSSARGSSARGSSAHGSWAGGSEA
jgi:uncharacterized protein